MEKSRISLGLSGKVQDDKSRISLDKSGISLGKSRKVWDL